MTCSFAHQRCGVSRGGGSCFSGGGNPQLSFESEQGRDAGAHGEQSLHGWLIGWLAGWLAAPHTATQAQEQEKDEFKAAASVLLYSYKL